MVILMIKNSPNQAKNYKVCFVLSNDVLNVRDRVKLDMSHEKQMLPKYIHT